MKSFRFGVVLLFLLGMVNIAPLLAQDVTGSVVNLSDTYSLTIPQDWVVSIDEARGGYYLTSADEAITVYVLEPNIVTQMTGMTGIKSPAAMLIAVNMLLHPDQPINDTIMEGMSGTYPVANWQYSSDGDEDRDGRLSLVQVDGTALAAFDAYAAAGDLDAALPQIDSIIASIAPAVTAAAEPDKPAEAVTSTVAQTEPIEPCFISVASAGTATLRVGPGPSRGAIAFLPANQQFEVTGRSVADDGSVWYQVNKDEAAPQSAALETWVAQAEVVSEGGCGDIAVTSAPTQLIRSGSSGVQNLNGGGTLGGTTNNNTTSGGTSGGGTSGGGTSSGGGSGGGSTGNSGSSGGGGQPAPAGAIIPLSGSYRFNAASETLASCEGTDTARIPTAEVVESDWLSWPATVSVGSGGASVVVNGDGFTRNDEGVYYGTFTHDDGTNSQARFTAVSPTNLSGSVTWNFRIDDHPCSATIGFSITR